MRRFPNNCNTEARKYLLEGTLNVLNKLQNWINALLMGLNTEILISQNLKNGHLPCSWTILIRKAHLKANKFPVLDRNLFFEKCFSYWTKNCFSATRLYGCGSKMTLQKNSHILIPRTCKYVLLHGKRTLQVWLRFRTLRWVGCRWLITWGLKSRELFLARSKRHGAKVEDREIWSIKRALFVIAGLEDEEPISWGVPEAPGTWQQRPVKKSELTST